ncbi:ferredoxin--NADP+ reductase [Leucobacter exalbidus]|uniref:ferredoxin--NADP(+) reductase n=1 Tax=Leucobacter exalbidus TaxID=662960 RepID=A0A940T4M1_9MICO|nr:FAD-dependent oxidoreductase [Leucobacter exalbidus]MBP1327377.1 ferredoxin--NADP+ reductase [Leucobacter exalbidus]
MSTTPTPHVAIVGSGPAGCYFAQSLLRSVPESTVTLFDRLVSPFGLIRYGVAADHQHTKAITRQFERLFQSEAVRFAGNIEVGRDLTLEDLRANFDAVVIATGLSADRTLGIPGANLPGVIGAGTITRTLNAHPDEQATLPALGTDIVIVGAGNVALDLLRFLVKGADDYEASDVADSALQPYLTAPPEHITLVSRSDAAGSKGDPQMWKELAALARATYISADAIAPDTNLELDRTAAARVAALTDLVSDARGTQPGPRVTLRFGATPQRIISAADNAAQVTGIELSSAHGSVTVPATSVITAIGFDAADHPAPLLHAIASSSESGRVEPGLYRTGWAKRGPHGAIPENRACAKSVAEELATDLSAGSIVPSTTKHGFSGLSTSVQAQAVDYTDWLVLDAHERENAPAGRVRRKLSDHHHMAAIARGTATTTRA